MRVLMTGEHVYPLPRVGTGRTPKPMPSASGQRVHDWIARGLAELGHDVRYFLTNRIEGPPPPGVTIVDSLTADADILHTYALRGPRHDLAWRGRYVATCHLDPRSRGLAPIDAPPNWIFVSPSLARTFGRTRYVVNGVDPAEYVYSETKGDYLLFLAAMDHAIAKGLDVALRVAQRTSVPLVVAGSAQTQEAVDCVARLCDDFGADYRGDVQGDEKAELLAGARALIFPSRFPEACPLGIAEALMSGTPVLCSASGASPEMIDDATGIVCHNEDEYVEALFHLDALSPKACRDKAMRDFHYLRMARDYVAEYERELSFTNASPKPSSL